MSFSNKKTPKKQKNKTFLGFFIENIPLSYNNKYVHLIPKYLNVFHSLKIIQKNSSLLVTRLHQVIIFRTFHLSDEKNFLMSSCFIFFFFSRGDCFFFIRFINIMYTLGKKSSKVKRMPPDNIYCY